MGKRGRKTTPRYELNADEVRLLISLLEGYAAQQERQSTAERVRAQLIIGKLEGRYR